MKRFRWGDVVPLHGEVRTAAWQAERVERAALAEPGGLHALAVHGVVAVDPQDVDAVHLRFTSAD